jgi:hypothetical protein
MLVFAVVEPRERQHGCPRDYVVVANNNHQLPLGSVTFEKASSQALSRSSNMRKNLADGKAQAGKDAMHKAAIIQLLMRKQVDIASKVYHKSRTHLSDTSKREIALYVHRLVAKTDITIWFPQLQEPMKSEERDVAAICSLEEAEREAKAAKDAFENAKKNAYSK